MLKRRRMDLATDTPAALPTAISPAAPASHGALDLRPRGRTVSRSLNGFGPSLPHDTFELPGPWDW